MPDTQRVWIFGEGKAPFVFDAVIGEDHESTVVATEQPLANGVPMMDHAYRLGDRLEIEAGVGDVWLGMRENVVAEPGEDGSVLTTSTDVQDAEWLRGEGGGDSSTRSQRAYQMLRGLQRSVAIFGCQTGLLFYPEMYLERLGVRQDKDSSSSCLFRATLREILRFNTETAVFPARKAGKTKRQASKKADNGEKKSKAVTDTEKAMSAAFSAFGEKVKSFRDDILGSVGLGGS